MQHLLMTGATGTIGQALYRRLSGRFRITGCARHKPAWWHDCDSFVQVDLKSHSPDALAGHICNTTHVVHVLNLAHLDQAVNASLTSALATHALNQSAARFIYISSIRVYGGLQGVVDEQTPAKPHPNDDYGFAKLACETLLAQKLANKIPLSLCRIGSVFSDQTSHKFPVPLNSRGKFLQKGQSTHLISANNVADALGHILLSEPVAAAQIYNITQETDGLNDYCRLADQLAHREQDSATYMTSSWGRRIRHLMSSLRSQAHSGPYLQVLENQLIREGFSYKNSVISDLREYTG